MSTDERESSVCAEKLIIQPLFSSANFELAAEGGLVLHVKDAELESGRVVGSGEKGLADEGGEGLREEGLGLIPVSTHQ